MERLSIAARHDWRPSLRRFDYGAAAIPAAAHWEEGAYYAFSSDEIDGIETVANTVQGLVMQAVDHAVDKGFLPLLGYNATDTHLIREAWTAVQKTGRRDPREAGLFGRLDFAYDGAESLKLLACQYDDPTGLFEASIVQWDWLQARFPEADQFNGLHEGLVEQWGALARGLRGRSKIHLTCATPDAARQGELAYLGALAGEAGLVPVMTPIQEFGWDGSRFVDQEEEPITWALKLYPWEALLADDFARQLPVAATAWLDPLWRAPASNHGILALLWELFPEHPNLCPASLTGEGIDGAGRVIRRAQFGLDRATQSVLEDGKVIAETGPAEVTGGFVHIAAPPLFDLEDGAAILQCWMVGDRCLGMTVREAEGPIFAEDAPLLPHLFR